jgi:DNA-binding transcriptional LysR family regulator
MNLRLLEIFRAVMVAQTTVSASRLLEVSQPAVSNGIRQLELDLGFELFTRAGNRLVPRAEAKTLYEESETLFAQLGALRQTAQDLKDNRLGPVRVYATPQLGNTVLPSAVRRFVADRPKVKVFADVYSSYRVIESVAAGTADFGLATGLEPQLDSIFRMVPIATIEMVCIVPHDHPLADREGVSPGDLRAFPLIGLESSARLSPLVRSAYRAAGEPYNPSIESHYCETLCLLVEAGAGIAIVDRFSAIARSATEKLKILKFHPSIAVEAWAIFPKSGTTPRLAEVLLEEVQLSTRNLIAGSSA